VDIKHLASIDGTLRQGYSIEASRIIDFDFLQFPHMAVFAVILHVGLGTLKCPTKKKSLKNHPHVSISKPFPSTSRTIRDKGETLDGELLLTGEEFSSELDVLVLNARTHKHRVRVKQSGIGELTKRQTPSRCRRQEEKRRGGSCGGRLLSEKSGPGLTVFSVMSSKDESLGFCPGRASQGKSQR
jgi:hypothetical protein